VVLGQQHSWDRHLDSSSSGRILVAVPREKGEQKYGKRGPEKVRGLTDLAQMV
jgi:hypothetical protein